MAEYQVRMERSADVSEEKVPRTLAIVYDLLFQCARKAEQPEPPAEDGEETKGAD